MSRGRHRIFLGMAAGVGKTYRMLVDGRAEAAAGREVVIGYLDPHGPAGPEAQAAGLERLPHRRITYRDRTLEELDLPGVVRRAPPRGRRGGLSLYRPCSDFTLSPKDQPLDPSQLIDQVIRPLSWVLYACDTSDGLM